MSKIKDIPKHEMPREKLAERGVDNLKDSEFLAILLRTGVKGKNVLEISKSILKKFPKNKLLCLDFEVLSKIKGIGNSKACLLLASFELAKRALKMEDDVLPTIKSAKEAFSNLGEIRRAKKEHFVTLYLNARNQLIHKETISIGILNASLIHPREIFKPAIDKLSASMIVAHNHPSGDVEPSDEDLEITKRLVNAGKILGIEVLDHIIVGERSFFSLKEKGLF